MRIPLISLLALALACGGQAQASPALNTMAQATASGRFVAAIPDAFQAKWREDLAQCGDMTETGLDIGAVGLYYYSYAPTTKSIRQTGPRSIIVAYTARRAEPGVRGYSEDRTASYEISADGRTLTETDASGDRIRRVRCGNSNTQTSPPRPAPIGMDSLIGDWEDGGPGCASIRRGRTATSIVFRAWYCEAGEQSAAPITLERLGDRVFTHRATDLNVVVHSGRMMQADAGPRSRKQFGDGLYVTEAGRIYNKKAATSRALAQAAYPAQLPQLRTGAYVSFPTRCAQASNATLEWWNGQFFSGGRKHPAYPRAVGLARPNGSQSFVADVKGWEDNKTYRVSFLVLSQSMYERDGLRYFHCSEARLPPMWRGETPPQTAAPRQPATASQTPVTPNEFREWQGNGNSYGYMCTVRIKGGLLALRSAPAGSQAGSLPNGATFVLEDVRVTSGRETWYRVGALERRGPGWVPSRFVTCDAEHFD